jgi:predicted transcriptional regulator
MNGFTPKPFFFLTELYLSLPLVLMDGYSTRQVAKQLGLTHAALSRYMSAGKIPAPKSVIAGGMKVHLWTLAEIEHVRQLLPKIANGRKTRYSKLREKQKAQTKSPVPRKQTKPKKKSTKPPKAKS